MIELNYEKLFGSDGTIRESRRVLAHAMLHAAGFAHEEKEDGEIPQNPRGYYDSAPLRAELCIEDEQSRRCTFAGSKWQIRRSN